MARKANIAGLMVAAFTLSAPLVYANTGNAGNFAAGHTASQTAASPAPSHNHEHGMMGKRGMKDKHNLTGKVLNLSEDQKKQLQSLHQKQMETMKGIFEQIKTNRENYQEEIIKASSDMNKINELQTQLKTLQAQMADHSLNSTLEIKKIMTHEQFAGFMALKKEKRLRKYYSRQGHHGWGKNEKGNRHKHDDQEEDQEE